ncbi:MAG: dTDP-4-dehydrorhamnose reductase [Chromatiales bacterium]
MAAAGDLRILVLGGTGQVGWELQRSLAPLGEVVAASRHGGAGAAVDLARPETLAPLIDRHRPGLVVNAAAYTAVDGAESDEAVARRVNAEAVGELGRLAADHAIPLIHYSTDFVFDGRARRPYTEADEPAPLGAYARTKLEGERALLASGATALIFRTGWVYGLHGRNFLLTMLRLFREREEVRVVDDQIGAPTWSRLLAEATAQVLAQWRAGAWRFGERGGIYHLSAGGQTSWYGFAAAILERSGLDCRLVPIPTQDYPTPARRPPWSVLDNGRFRDTFGLALPDWRISLEQCMGDRRQDTGNPRRSAR